MGTAVGDLVYAMIIDDSNWQAGIGRGIAGSRRFDNAIGGGAANAKKSLGFIARGFYEAGESASAFSQEAGVGLTAVASTLTTIIYTEQSIMSLGKAYQWLAKQQIIVNALSGPKGWIKLAAAVAAAAAAFYFFSLSEKKAGKDIEDNSKKIDDHIKKLKELENSRKDSKASYLAPGAEGQAEFQSRDKNLSGAQKQLDLTREQIYANEELIKKLMDQSAGWVARPEGSVYADLQKQYEEAIARRKELAYVESEGAGQVKAYKEKDERKEAADDAAEAEQNYTAAKQEQAAKYQDVLNSLTSEIAMLGQSEAMKEKMKLADSGSGYTAEELITLGKMIDKKYELLDVENERKRALEEELSIMEEAAGVWQENESAEEKYYDSIQRNQELFWAGFLSDEMLQRADDKALKAWADSEKGGAKKAGKTSEGPKALEQGTQEAWQFIVSAMNPATDANLEIADNTKRAADALDRMDQNRIEEVGLVA